MSHPPVPNQYDVGDLVRAIATFVGTDGVSGVMPSQVLFFTRSPDPGGSVATYLFGAGGASIQALASNSFAKDFTVNVPGVWSLRWAATGQGQTAEEWQISVDRSFIL